MATEITGTPVPEPTPVVAPVVAPVVVEPAVKEMTNDDAIAAFPKTTNEFGTEQVHIDENGQIEGLASADLATPTPAPATE